MQITNEHKKSNILHNTIASPFRGISSGMSINSHECLNGVKQICFCYVGNTSLIHQQDLYQLHGKCHSHVVQAILHGLSTQKRQSSATDLTVDSVHPSPFKRAASLYLSQVKVILLHVNKVIAD